MKFSYSLVSFALIAGLGIGTAIAQDAAGDPPAFSDISKDGKFITRGDIPKDNERLKQLRMHFGENDADHNGKIDEKEYNQYLSKDNPLQKHP